MTVVHVASLSVARAQWRWSERN